MNRNNRQHFKAESYIRLSGTHSTSVKLLLVMPSCIVVAWLLNCTIYCLFIEVVLEGCALSCPLQQFSVYAAEG